MCCSKEVHLLEAFSEVFHKISTVIQALWIYWHRVTACGWYSAGCFTCTSRKWFPLLPHLCSTIISMQLNGSEELTQVSMRRKMFLIHLNTALSGHLVWTLPPLETSNSKRKKHQEPQCLYFWKVFSSDLPSTFLEKDESNHGGWGCSFCWLVLELFWQVHCRQLLLGLLHPASPLTCNNLTLSIPLFTCTKTDRMAELRGTF